MNTGEANGNKRISSPMHLLRAVKVRRGRKLLLNILSVAISFVFTVNAWCQCELEQITKNDSVCMVRIPKIIEVEIPVINSLVDQYLPDSGGNIAMIELHLPTNPKVLFTAHIYEWRMGDTVTNYIYLKGSDTVSHSTFSIRPDWVSWHAGMANGYYFTSYKNNKNYLEGTALYYIINKGKVWQFTSHDASAKDIFDYYLEYLLSVK